MHIEHSSTQYQLYIFHQNEIVVGRPSSNEISNLLFSWTVRSRQYEESTARYLQYLTRHYASSIQSHGQLGKHLCVCNTELGYCSSVKRKRDRCMKYTVRHKVDVAMLYTFNKQFFASSWLWDCVIKCLTTVFRDTHSIFCVRSCFPTGG